MSSPNQYLILVISSVFGFHLWILRSQEITCNPNDMKALNGFSSCLKPHVLGWNNSSVSDCCTWTGVTCDDSASKRVVALELGQKNLYGTICDSIAGLDQLRILNLSHNYLHGTLPTELFHLKNLEILDVSDNDFVGRIPEELHLSGIRYVNVSKNGFFGSTGGNLCKNSPHVKILDISMNNFYGEVPQSVGNCTSLQYLRLNGNNFRSLPKGIFHLLQDLKVLHLQNNSFYGPFDHLSSLVELDISSNSFSGVLPDVFGSLGKLEKFSASSNNFNGTLPVSLHNSPLITSLDLHNNSLNGPVNLNCSAMVHLKSLHLGSNNFNGSILQSLSSCKNLTMLNLGHNNLDGQVPEYFMNLKALTVLSLSRTNLVNLSSTLNILQHCKNLTVLLLSENFQEEEIPSDRVFKFRSLRVLSIAYCKLKGSIPPWLLGCNGLQFLDLSRNHLSGTIPSWFNEFKYLFYVDLSNNSFTGEIPKGLTQLRALIDMNISLEGPALGFPLFRTGIDGATFRYNNIWSFPPTLDLSYNMITGPVWPSFGDLRRLHVLNLNENRLTGSIPESLSGMKSLEVLDLSHNKLSGKIPISLAELSFLSKFSVAYNELNGEIPMGGQFMTFPYSSFEGNGGLCGGPYVACPVQHAAIDEPTGDEGTTVFGPQFGYGVATGFVLTVTVCFMSGWVLPRETTFE
ncbi:phytosulfokin receptor 1, PHYTOSULFOKIN RECEPTOR 1 [Hibiscus trionum]|uniref:Phytosulfokin receptor 1, PHYTOSULFOKIN RECEPTOR 1 n=1 Tax=Hibiscus trionum TaxID=183268 RepID=A0A9W7MLX4_HIBTR|nr:phytosulfokin receptor 1, PHYTOSULFOKIN RECEPTOR 1 [Hibiscus trionum]